MITQEDSYNLEVRKNYKLKIKISLNNNQKYKKVAWEIISNYLKKAIFLNIKEINQ
jgi:hypothetical protein